MNIYLIHGDNSLKSYERLQMYIDKAKKNKWEIEYINSDDKNIKDLLISNNLFIKKRLLIINKYNLINNDLLKLINKLDNDINIIIYHDKFIPASFIKKLKGVKKNEVFKLSKYLWKFIDNFYPGNTKTCLRFFREAVKSDPVELIFTVLVGHLKDVYLVSISDSNLNYPSWRIYKLKNISNKYTLTKLKKTIDELSKIDLNVKTSSATLKDELDLFILRKLE